MTVIFILFLLLAMQFMSLGLAIGKIGEPKTGTFSRLDIVINIFFCFLYIYVIWSLYCLYLPVKMEN